MAKQQTNNGNWFETDGCENWNEASYFDGHNMISVATGSQWDHETLWKTKKGSWILQRSSQYQHIPTTWDEIDESEAMCWLVNNGHECAMTADNEI